ncbi:MAG TPA: type II secretion system protein N [Casimicrobiaceae bacterium]|jgi:hypothetical protein|nr:type II secretion system protein N [Casimicrobiaceae bacterium]
MRSTLAVALGAVLLLATLVSFAPASLLDARVAEMSGGRMRLSNASGTIWNGSGELWLLPAGPHEPLRWRLDALPLLRGEVRVAIDHGGEGAPAATLAYGRDHLELRDLDLALPIESLLPVAGPARIAGVGGTLRVHVDHLARTADTLDAQLTVQWPDASVPGPRPDTRIALGTVSVALNGRGAELGGPVQNSGGDVEITGQLAVAATGAAKLDATLRPRTTTRERADMIAAALSSIGAGDGEGGYRVHWSGAWR